MTVSVPISTVDPTKVFINLRIETVDTGARRDMKLGKITVGANAINIEVGNPGMASYHIQSFVEWQLVEFK